MLTDLLSANKIFFEERGLIQLEIEKFISGYCRTADESRMVCVVTENGKLLEVDCSYECCPFTADCTVAQSIRELLK